MVITENGLAERHTGSILLWDQLIRLLQWSWIKNTAGRVGREEWLRSYLGSDWLVVRWAKGWGEKQKENYKWQQDDHQSLNISEIYILLMVGQWHLSSYIKGSIIVTSLHQRFYSWEKVEKESHVKLIYQEVKFKNKRDIKMWTDSHNPSDWYNYANSNLMHDRSRVLN